MSWSRRKHSLHLWSVAALLAGGVAVAGCSSQDSQSSVAGDRITVAAAFYPLQFVAEEVGGDRVTVRSLTPPGAEPHDVELSPQQVAELSEADLVLYIKGFQPAVDEAVEQVVGDRAVDVSQGVPLLTGHGDGDHADQHGSGTTTDPHIWLNPRNMVTIAGTVSERLQQVDAGSASLFQRNQQQLDGELVDLDARWIRGTKSCTSRDLVVSHEAFGYLADAYGFEQVGISGLSPEAEPSPARVAEVADFVKRGNVRTIYFETLVDPRVAQTVADETGAQTAVLDPLEGLPEGSDATYLSVMAQNLQTVVAGQPCR